MKAIKISLYVLYVVLFLFMVFVVNGKVENALVNQDIEAFKARGEFVVAIGNTRYYAVKQQYDYEDLSRDVLRGHTISRIGSTSDIFVTSRNPVPGNPITEWLSKNMWLGHAGIVIDDEGRETIEITGNISPEENVVQIWTSTWLSTDRGSPQIAVLRIKDTTEEQREAMIEYAKSKLGLPYNYTFIFNRANAFYCSDLVSRAVSAGGININYDHLATTGSDMIVSPNTYLVYYREKYIVDGENYYRVYYLTKNTTEE